MDRRPSSGTEEDATRDEGEELRCSYDMLELHFRVWNWEGERENDGLFR